MSVSLATLLKAAPFPKDQLAKILPNLDQLTEEQKNSLSHTAWAALSSLYFAQQKYERDKLMLEISQGKRKFDKKDFDEARKKVDQEFAQKLESAGTEEQIQGVRSKLQQFFRAKKAPLDPNTLTVTV